MAMRQRVATIGPEENGIGIVTEPARDPSHPEPDSTLPNVVFLNAGVPYRVGPHGLHVSLARLLARGGFHSYGIGYNHRDRIYESFPELRGRLQVAYFPTANHVFTELAQREALMTEVSQWCRIHFG